MSWTEFRDTGLFCSALSDPPQAQSLNHMRSSEKERWIHRFSMESFRLNHPNTSHREYSYVNYPTDEVVLGSSSRFTSFLNVKACCSSSTFRLLISTSLNPLLCFRRVPWLAQIVHCQRSPRLISLHLLAVSRVPHVCRRYHTYSLRLI